jgi:hypothetical protein
MRQEDPETATEFALRLQTAVHRLGSLVSPAELKALYKGGLQDGTSHLLRAILALTRVAPLQTASPQLRRCHKQYAPLDKSGSRKRCPRSRSRSLALVEFWQRQVCSLRHARTPKCMTTKKIPIQYYPRWTWGRFYVMDRDSHWAEEEESVTAPGTVGRVGVSGTSLMNVRSCQPRCERRSQPERKPCWLKVMLVISARITVVTRDPGHWKGQMDVFRAFGKRERAGSGKLSTSSVTCFSASGGLSVKLRRDTGAERTRHL